MANGADRFKPKTQTGAARGRESAISASLLPNGIDRRAAGRSWPQQGIDELVHLVRDGLVFPLPGRLLAMVRFIFHPPTATLTVVLHRLMGAPLTWKMARYFQTAEVAGKGVVSV